MATEIFVGNTPYEGEVYGTASDVRFVLFELAEALGLEVEEGPDGWVMGGKPISTTVEKSKVWVNLSALPESLIRVVKSDELNTLDLYLMETVEVDGDGGWSKDGTLVVFYADWSEACRAMEQTLAYVAQSPSLNVEFLNVDNSNSDVYRRRVGLFEGEEIPFFVILDDKGRKLASFSGFFTYAEFLEKLEENFSRQD